MWRRPVVVPAVVAGRCLNASRSRPEALDALRAVAIYRQLGSVETAFRCLKTFSLRVCPIHHRRPDRVRAHFFLRMLAYHLE